MVEPSKEGIIRPLEKETHSSIYDDELEGLYDTSKRIDIPFQYARKLGLGIDTTFARVYDNGGQLKVSLLDLEEESEMITPTYWCKYNGNPRSAVLEKLHDDLFIILPTSTTKQFDIGTEVVFEYVREVPESNERYILIKPNNKKEGTNE